MAVVDFGINELLGIIERAEDKGKAVKKRILNRVSLMMLKRAKQLTPVISGNLRRCWFVEVSQNEAALENNSEYAPAVNNGHKQLPGRYVPAIGKKLKMSYVRGQFMLEKSIGQTVKYDLEREMQDAMKDVLG